MILHWRMAWSVLIGQKVAVPVDLVKGGWPPMPKPFPPPPGKHGTLPTIGKGPGELDLTPRGKCRDCGQLWQAHPVTEGDTLCKEFS